MAKYDIQTLTQKSQFAMHYALKNVSEYMADNGRGMEELMAGLMLQNSSLPDAHITGITLWPNSKYLLVLG